MDERKDTISLWRLVQEIKNKIPLFTRENFVSYDALPYDYESAEQQVMQRLMASQPAHHHGFFLPQHGPDAFSPAQEAHEIFDRLCGVSAALPLIYVGTG